MKKMAILLLALLISGIPVSADGILAREGAGRLEKVDGLYVLHVSGTPYEMGYQHGKLLRPHVTRLITTLVEEEGGREIEIPGMGIKKSIKSILKVLFASQRPYYKKRFLQELKGLADGAGLPEEMICLGNHLPELFHCSGFALKGSATVDGEVYHGRVLDYATDWHLQEHAVVIVARPKGRIAFANVSFAGFIGSVTGMNAKGVSIGEMGGGGQFFWAGEPMSFLVRRVLEEADSLPAALDIFKTGPRTCQYYYVIAHGPSRQAAGLSTTWQDLEVVKPGAFHPQLPDPVKDCVLLSAGDRYKKLVARAKRDHGRFDTEKSIRLMDAPVSMKNNLHNAMMRPVSGDLHVAYAAKGGRSAWDQKYVHLNLFKLLEEEKEKALSVKSKNP